ncbi:MAG: DUF4293 domain-containing protein [Chitinophagaceae bacterium]|nr:DUF4293 domain-containing protein [Chitinophagaceae bacterium]MCB9044886.1 DUF4293 domain-containing protein [Chitinophagales bacterium]
MIQRIQTVWLLVASLLSLLLFYFNIVTINYASTGSEINQSFTLLGFGVQGYLLAALAAVLVVLPLVAIFMFRNRKKQSLMTILAMVLNFGFVAFSIMSIDSFTTNHKPAVTGSSYGLAAFVPLVSEIFLFMAWRGIRKDEKLVRSTDRLR